MTTTSFGKKFTRNIRMEVSDEICPIRRHEWDMLKRRIGSIKSPPVFLSICYSILFGIFITALFTLITLPEGVSDWRGSFFMLTSVFALLLAIVLVVVEKKVFNFEKKQVADLLQDMGEIEGCS